MVINNIPQGWNELHKLCYNDDEQGLREFLKTNANNNMLDARTNNDYNENDDQIPNGSNALHIALRRNSNKCAIILLEDERTEILAKDKPDGEGNGIYHLCNNLDLANVMSRLDDGQHKLKNIRGENPLHVCRDPATSLRIFRWFKDNANKKDNNGDRPYDKIMKNAAENVDISKTNLKQLQNVAILQLFINDCESNNDFCDFSMVNPGEYTSIISEYGNSMLHYASRVGDLPMIKHLSKQIDPRIGNQDGLTPLGEAVNSNKGEMANEDHKIAVINFLYNKSRSNYLAGRGRMATALPYIKAMLPFLDVITDAIFVSELYSEESATQFSPNTLLAWKVLSIGFIILPVLVYLVHFIKNLRNKYTTRAGHYALIPVYPIIDEFIPLSRRNAGDYIEVIYEALPQMLIQTQIAFILIFGKGRSSTSFFLSMSFSLMALMAKLPKQIYLRENTTSMKFCIFKWSRITNVTASRFILSLEFLANGLTLVLVASMFVYAPSVVLVVVFVGLALVDKLYRFSESWKAGRPNESKEEEEKVAVNEEEQYEDDWELEEEKDKLENAEDLEAPRSKASVKPAVKKSRDSGIFVLIMSVLVEAFTSKIIFNSRFDILEPKHNAKYFKLNRLTFAKIILYGASLALLTGVELSEKVQFYLMLILCCSETVRLAFYCITTKNVKSRGVVP